MEKDIDLEIGDYLAAYHELEDRFLEFIRFVPLLERHDEVISFELASLASSIGNWVETAFYRMARYDGYEGYPRISKDLESVDGFREAFEPHYQLSQLSVRVLPRNYAVIRPFEEFSTNQSPEWFKAYSKFKHDLKTLFNRMNLRLTVKALGALFLLSVYPQEMREHVFREGLIHSQFGQLRSVDDRLTILNAVQARQRTLDYKKLVGSVYAETPLFRFEFPRLREDGKMPHPSKL